MTADSTCCRSFCCCGGSCRQDGGARERGLGVAQHAVPTQWPPHWHWRLWMHSHPGQAASRLLSQQAGTTCTPCACCTHLRSPKPSKCRGRALQRSASLHSAGHQCLHGVRRIGNRLRQKAEPLLRSEKVIQPLQLRLAPGGGPPARGMRGGRLGARDPPNNSAPGIIALAPYAQQAAGLLHAAGSSNMLQNLHARQAGAACPLRRQPTWEGRRGPGCTGKAARPRRLR